MYILHCAYLFTKHLGCFYLLATVNNAAMNMSVQISLQIPPFNSFQHIHEVELLCHVVIHF